MADFFFEIPEILSYSIYFRMVTYIYIYIHIYIYIMLHLSFRLFVGKCVCLFVCLFVCVCFCGLFFGGLFVLHFFLHDSFCLCACEPVHAFEFSWNMIKLRVLFCMSHGVIFYNFHLFPVVSCPIQCICCICFFHLLSGY